MKNQELSRKFQQLKAKHTEYICEVAAGRTSVEEAASLLGTSQRRVKELAALADLEAQALWARRFRL